MKMASKVNKRKDKRIFTKTASRTNSRNLPSVIQRGGTRL